MPKYYCTYGCGTNLDACYSEVEALNYEDARKAIFAGTNNGRFAFMYNAHEFAGQVEKHKLTKVPLQPQVHYYGDK